MPKTILLLDDEEAVARSLSAYLRRSGYQVEVAHTPAEAVHVAAHHPGPIDLLLSDLVMPGMSGPEVAERIREIRPGIRVLIMSGYLKEDVLEGGEDVLGRGFISKPFEMEELLARVEEMLRPEPG